MAAPDAAQEVFNAAKRDFVKALPGNIQVRQVIASGTSDATWNAIDQLQAQQLRDRKFGHLSYIQPFMDALKSYAAVIEVFVQVQPDIMALVWGPIKLILQLIDNIQGASIVITRTIGHIGELLPRFERLRPLLEKAGPKQTLALFYRDILDFHLELLQFLHMPRARHMFEAIWPKRKMKIEVIENNIKKHAQLLHEGVVMEDILEAHMERERALRHYEQTETRQIQQAFDALQSQISPRAYDRRMQDILARVCPNSFRWLTSNSDFGQWLNAGLLGPNLLWLQGIPGAGKTYLSSAVVHEVRRKNETAIFVFPTHDQNGLSATSLLQSLLFQLASNDNELKSMLNPRQAAESLSTVRALFTDVVRSAGRTFVIVDGLDEVHDFDRKEFLTALLESQSDCRRQGAELVICVSSRAEDDLRELLGQSAVTIRVDQSNSAGIQTFVNTRFREWMASSDFLPEGQDEIRDLLQAVPFKSKGMFLYARIVIDNVVDLPSIDRVRQELRALPESLDDAYARVLSRIQALPVRRQAMARKVLACLGCSPKPPTVFELEQLVLVGDGGSDAAPVVDSPTNLVKLCGPIIEVIDDMPRFVHFTVNEYIFKRNPPFLNRFESTFDLLISNLAYLRHDSLRPDVAEEVVKENILAGRYRLQAYATITWLRTVKECVQLQADPRAEAFSALNELLTDFASELENPGFRAEADDDRKGQSRDQAAYIFILWPGTPHFIHKALEFWRDLPKDLWTCENPETWTHFDPLVVSSACARVDRLYDELLGFCPGGEDNQHMHGCNCNKLKRHYGALLYRCHYFDCSRRRNGFVSRKDLEEHMENHCRPYKCPVKECDFSVMGFHTMSKLEEHTEKHHQVAREYPPVRPESPVVDESSPPADQKTLEFRFSELVIEGNLEEFNMLWILHKETLSHKMKLNLFHMATIQGSMPMVKQLLQWDDASGKSAFSEMHEREGRNQFVTEAFESQNEELITWMLKKTTVWEPVHSAYHDVVVRLIKTDNLAYFEAWIKIFESMTYLSKTLADELTKKPIFTTVKRFPRMQAAMMDGWRRLREANLLRPETLGAMLVTVAQTTLSTDQARALIDLGANVNFPNTLESAERGVWKNPTPFAAGKTALEHAGKRSSKEAASFVKFLLFEGADPFASSGRFRPHRWECAAALETWLNVTFEELLATTMLVRHEKLGVPMRLLTEKLSSIKKKDRDD